MRLKTWKGTYERTTNDKTSARLFFLRLHERHRGADSGADWGSGRRALFQENVLQYNRQRTRAAAGTQTFTSRDGADPRTRGNLSTSRSCGPSHRATDP